MAWIILCIIVLAGTAIWPLGRWALKDNAEPSLVGFWVSLTVAVACAVGTVLTGDWRGVPAGVWLAGGAMSVAYAVGFWIEWRRQTSSNRVYWLFLPTTASPSSPGPYREEVVP